MENTVVKEEIKTEYKKESIIHIILNFFKKNVLPYILLAVPFILMDAFIRIMAAVVDYNKKSVTRTSIIFELSVVLFIVLFVRIVGGKIGKIIYGVIFALFTFMFLVNGVYYALTSYFFSFRLVFMAGEGSAYIWDTIKGSPIYVWIELLLIILFGILAIVKMDTKKVNATPIRVVGGIAIIIVFIIAQFIIPISLGKGNESLRWDSFRKPKNVYEEFSDVNKNMKICGFLKYTIRDFHKTFFRTEEKISKDEEKFLSETYADKKPHQSNQYTGVFEGKNIIFLQLEGIDTWLLTKEDMPNLYRLKEEGMNFTSHYSYYNGGGSTFNSEFAINTGFITPISYSRNAYTFSSNTWKDNLPQIYNELGYSTNCYHMNSREFYSRGVNYEAWGYDGYYSLLDEEDYAEDDFAYEMDTELFLNEDFYNIFFDKKEGIEKSEKTFKYLITYTPHTPFVTNKGVGGYLADKVYGDSIPDMDEEAVARMMATETDDMVGLLIEGLKKEGLYDNTVIIAYADHYLYTINDKSVLDKFKETDNNLINNTPFFIWSSDTKDLGLNIEVDKTNSQLDITPTVLNLFGIEYDENRYIGRDILDDNYVGYAFFDDYSFVTGDTYVNDMASVTESEIKDISKEINRLIKKNDLTLKYDYLKKYK